MSKTFSNNVPVAGRVRECLELVRKQNVKGRVLVDVGSSFGWMEQLLSKLKPKKLIGFEPNPPAVEYARENFGKFAEFRVGSALDLTIKDGYADLVILFDVIEHVPVNTESKALKEINRILKKDGVLLLSTPNSHWLANFLDPAWYFGHRHYSKRGIASIIKNANFEIEEHYIKGGYISIFYTSWFYISKWIFQQNQPAPFLIGLDDKSYQGSRGLVTHYVKARKKNL